LKKTEYVAVADDNVDADYDDNVVNWGLESAARVCELLHVSSQLQLLTTIRLPRTEPSYEPARNSKSMDVYSQSSLGFGTNSQWFSILGTM